MTTRKRGRGRPKGTGIDDSRRLIAMALELAATPGMRPTTAIKAIGITDQATIRRLRDKYHRACQNCTLAALVEKEQPRGEPKRPLAHHMRPANDDVRAETTSAARLEHYALALQSSVVAVQHRISARASPSDDDALRELLDQQYRLSSVLLGLISESCVTSPTLPH